MTGQLLSPRSNDRGLLQGSPYPEQIEDIREREYPSLRETTYLDHAGTTPYPASLIDAFSQEMKTNLFGNPHSASSSSQLSTQRVDDARLRVLRFFNACPHDFDVVFVANATAGIKLVADALRDYDECGFWYGYHRDAHTSLVGVRELAARGRRCFADDEEVEDWISCHSPNAQSPVSVPTLFAYPAQSNMTGRRLPLDWCRKLRVCNIYSLLDAASLVSTSPLDLSDADSAPDFTVLSFYKIFGFPDLGALIVRKGAHNIFDKRKYFGGGTVGMVTSLEDQWHAKKSTSVHDQLEDGTLPFHSIIALHSSLDVHERLYGSMENISRHTCSLAKILYDSLAAKKHANGTVVCEMYKHKDSSFDERTAQGPIVSFNLRNSDGEWVGKSEVEKLAAVKNIQIRSGTLCNPGGMAYHLGLKTEEMKRNYNAGQRCGDDNDIIDGKPTGGLRVSLGAMSSIRDVNRFLDFIDEFYVDKSNANTVLRPQGVMQSKRGPQPSSFYVDKLCVYPIKSCGAFIVPDGKQWEVKPEGLAWDREWCLIHQGTGVALNQKRYPRMALIRPVIDLDNDILQISRWMPGADDNPLKLPLSDQYVDISTAELCENSMKKSSTVCGDRVPVQIYSSPVVSAFFSEFLGVPCTLARFPANSSLRYSKHQQRSYLPETPSPFHSMPGAFPQPNLASQVHKNPIRLSNESPMLLVSRSSVNKLNETIKSYGKSTSKGTRAVAADVFRANIIVAENPALAPSSRNGDSNGSAAGSICTPPTLLTEHPYVEDTWRGFRVGPHKFDVLGSCQRCQMVCVDQFTAVRSEEPFTTLAKTRKVDGKVTFGKHVCLSHDNSEDGVNGRGKVMIMTGQVVEPLYEETV
ncbi:molybdenum cofactor sulfurase [Histoplasma capsulatum var. duboisii H88]|uniref:Molybdenum cofactor sulfurase n=2 Tax=Ajellomyces capsulatus TaxID=5037 RepID=F0U6C5_AJEC8|nr:molybdenum cofactor sulfurase [Histoplasma capsulatum H143]EGC41461.1 molybdenum cofactor sulfurase [Histoplasma capsulatum var. duboisii H88]QSS52113.1 molybdenum cofactor sulfurase [Histoplasma capsulatum var. duboisii H88]